MYRLKSTLLRTVPVVVSAVGSFSFSFCTNDESSKNLVYRRSEVQKHKTKETGVWVIYKDGIYDITSFVANHPGNFLHSINCI